MCGPLTGNPETRTLHSFFVHLWEREGCIRVLRTRTDNVRSVVPRVLPLLAALDMIGVPLGHVRGLEPSRLAHCARQDLGGVEGVVKECEKGACVRERYEWK